MLVALENVYAVLRAEDPTAPAKILLGSLIDDVTANISGTHGSVSTTLRHLEDVRATLGVPSSLPVADGETTLVHVDDVVPLLAMEHPRTDANVTATELLKLAISMRRQKSWSQVQQAKALVALCQKVAAVDEQIDLNTPAGQRTLRMIIREEISRVGVTADQNPAFDATSLREVIAGEVRAGVAAADRDQWSAEPLSAMINAFLIAQYPKEKSAAKVGSKHREDVETRLGAFLARVGDKAVRDISRDDLKAYRDLLDRLPDRFELRLKTKDMLVAIELNGKRKVPYPHIGPITVDLKWLGPVIRLLTWLVQEEKIEKNPADGIRSNQLPSNTADNTKRLPFKPDQISKLFAITGCQSPKTALYWLPLLMLATGARPNELAQLKTNDIDMHFNGRPHLNVLCLIDDDDEAIVPETTTQIETDERRVKTVAGRRMVPLHPLLIKAGFTDFVADRHRDGAKQLFRELRADKHGFWSSAILKRINRIIRQELLITNRKYSAYSLRHNFIDACKPESISTEARMKIMGHQLGGIQGVYGNPYVLPHESALIDLIRFEGVDFGKYLPA